MNGTKGRKSSEQSQSKTDHRTQPKGAQAQIQRVLLWRDDGAWRENLWRVGNRAA